MRVNNINELDRDAFALILKWLSPRDWGTASRVCKLWNERAHLDTVRQVVNQKFLPWLVEKNLEAFDEIKDFIDTIELKNFLMGEDLPIAVKIFELNRLKSHLYVKDKIHLYFTKTLSKPFLSLTNLNAESLAPLNKFIDRLNFFLVHDFRLSMNPKETNVIPQFNEILSQFYQEGAIIDFHKFLPKELCSILAAENSQENLDQSSNLEELAPSVRPQFLKNYGVARASSGGFVNFKHDVLLGLFLIALAGLCCGTGGYLVNTVGNDYTSTPPALVGGVILLIFGGIAGLYALRIGGTTLLAYCSARKEAVETLNSNNTDTIIEIPREATERTPLIPPNQRHDNIENNNNAPVVEEASAGTVSEVEMQTDDGERRFSMK